MSTSDYKHTLNLPKTSFPMRADLVHREAQFQKQWDAMDLYGKIRAARAAAGRSGRRFLLHDGPPYVTGELHIGTGLNKILKDVVVRYKTMRGLDSPYVPGWDCHGLPTEHKVLQELGPEAHTMPKIEIRQLCRKYALKNKDIQLKQFKMLGVLGDWEHPYLTLDPKYEASEMEVFRDLVANGCVVRRLMPIHWCLSCQTALADAELEYDDEPSPSIYVKFHMIDSVKDLFPAIGDEPVSMLIWTTTPWTLPANLAIALHPKFEYAAVRYQDPHTNQTEVIVLAHEMVADVMKACRVKDYEPLGKVTGQKLEHKRYRHCFEDRACPVVLAEYVTLEDGTGCVHTAPGHGVEDYGTGLQYGLEAYSPVGADGAFTEQVGQFAGQNVFDANPKITEQLRQQGDLLFVSEFTHSYPHCWRCKRPVIFRATHQWFISLGQNDLRGKMLEQIRNVRWFPDWGQIRIESMVGEAPDWCISRQKCWGVPIPAFYCKGCGEAILSRETAEAARQLFAQHGTDAWFTRSAAEILPPGFACPHCGGTEFDKESDILDVWFDSGTSHRGVMANTAGLGYPADLYLEGTDQHRGWFQKSLLTAVGSSGSAPFRAVLTHGFVVDEKGEKMSKSRGNFISVADALKEFGGDIQRLWVTSIDYRRDINTSSEIIGKIAEAYRRIRNTFRYLLANLSDYDPRQHAVPRERMLEIDRWALAKAHRVIDGVLQAYEDYQFHRVYHLVHDFCTVELSAFYLDVLKDRMYTFAPNSVERRSGQTAMYEILLALTRLLAPVLVHTTEEVWGHVRHHAGGEESIHLTLMPEVNPSYFDEELERRWDELELVRTDAAREIEKLRAAKTLGSSLEASVELSTDDPELLKLLRAYESQLPTLFIVSEARVKEGQDAAAPKGELLSALGIRVTRSQHPKCARCWNLRPSVGQDAAHPTICDRCVVVVRQLERA